MESPFLFVACQAGAEAVLKEETGRKYPGLRAAFSRPGFVTFKQASGEPFSADFELDSVFARAYSLSLGRLPVSPGDAREALARFPQPFRLHVFERDRHPPGEEPLGFARGEWAERAAVVLRRALGELNSAKPELGDGVVDVIAVEEAEWWLGFHRHGPSHSPWPGGRPSIELPENAPSRAYLKLEEVLLWSGAPVREGDQAVELGSAPGGAVAALLGHGLNVVGIDPGEMDPRVTAFARGGACFTPIQKTVAEITAGDLPRPVHWLLADMNVEPRITLAAVDRLVTGLGMRRRGGNDRPLGNGVSRSSGPEGVQGVLLTLKLNRWSMAREIPSWLEHLRAMGLVRLRAAQLSYHRQEIVVYGLTRSGMARLRGAWAPNAP